MASKEIEQTLELAIRLAREAGQIQRERYETDFEVRSKSTAIDLVSEIDKQSPADNLANFARMARATRAIRRDGSAALDLCYVAAGRTRSRRQQRVIAPGDPGSAELTPRTRNSLRTRRS